MPTAREPYFFATTLIAITALLAPIAGYAADKPPYQTATAAMVQEQIITPSKKIGEYDGDTYYFKYAGMGTGQIFRVSNADPTKFAPVGLILTNSYHIQENEKSGFYAIVTDKPASYFTGDTSKPQLVEPPPAAAAAPATTAASTAPVTFTGKASWGDDGHTPVVQFQNDSKFNNDVVAWRKGHIEISRNGAKFADLGYTGGGYGEGAAKRGLKTSLNEINAAVSNNRKADVLSNGWEITTIKGTHNTSVVTAASANGIYQQNPYGLEGESVAATELFKQQVDPNFTYPGYDKLRQAAGLPPLANASAPQQPTTKPATATQ